MTYWTNYYIPVMLNKGVKVGTYRICGEVSLGFSHKDDCRIDEDCKTGEKE